jgi:hypothetical protein
MRSTKVLTETQKYLYQNSNFIAEVGGYMGLLLGISIFTVYQERINLNDALIEMKFIFSGFIITFAKRLHRNCFKRGRKMQKHQKIVTLTV